jgi:hypothetical protein
MLARRHTPLIAWALLAAACGDPLAPGGFLGTPRIHLTGLIKGNPGYAGQPARPRMGVLWGAPGGPPADATASLASAVSTSFPTQFQLDLFDAPERPPGEIRSSDGKLEAVMGLGRLVAVDDVDGDARFAVAGGMIVPPDLYIGAAPRHVVLYADGPGLPGPALRRLLANPERLGAGYQIGRGLCGEDGAPDRLELVAADAPVVVELVPATPLYPVVAGCLRLASE